MTRESEEKYKSKKQCLLGSCIFHINYLVTTLFIIKSVFLNYLIFLFTVFLFCKLPPSLNEKRNVLSVLSLFIIDLKTIDK